MCAWYTEWKPKGMKLSSLRLIFTRKSWSTRSELYFHHRDPCRNNSTCIAIITEMSTSTWITWLTRVFTRTVKSLQPDFKYALLEPGLHPWLLLERLPLELVIYVARFLPPSTAVYFTICYGSVYSVVGAQYLESLRPEDRLHQRLDFLSLLERDLRQYILAHIMGNFMHLTQYSGGKR